MGLSEVRMSLTKRWDSQSPLMICHGGAMEPRVMKAVLHIRNSPMRISLGIPFLVISILGDLYS